MLGVTQTRSSSQLLDLASSSSSRKLRLSAPARWTRRPSLASRGHVASSSRTWGQEHDSNMMI